MSDKREEWLAGLKTGDSVYEVCGGRTARMVTVKITPKQIRTTGAIVGVYPKDGISTYGQFRLIPHSKTSLQEYRAEQEKKTVIGDIVKQLRDCTDEQLLRIAAILGEPKGEGDGNAK